MGNLIFYYLQIYLNDKRVFICLGLFFIIYNKKANHDIIELRRYNYT